MSDITMCYGEKCPVREKCKRYTAEPGWRQARFGSEPGWIKDGKFYCTYFWNPEDNNSGGIEIEIDEVNNTK